MSSRELLNSRTKEMGTVVEINIKNISECCIFSEKYNTSVTNNYLKNTADMGFHKKNFAYRKCVFLL